MQYKWKAMITVAMGTMMGTMDASITTIAFPELTLVFKSDLATVMWVAVAYILVSSSLMLVTGKISDLMGRKRIYAWGMAIFTLGMCACAFARGIDQLIIARIVQALGAAMCISCGTAIVAEAFPPNEIGKGMGFLGMSVSAGFILGPIVGGFLLEWLDWRALFYARAPVGIITFILSIALLKKDSGKPGKFQLDLLGAFISSCGLFSLIFGLSQLNRPGTTATTFLLYMVAGIAMLVLFVFQERRAKDPLVDLSLFRNPIFTLSMMGLFLFFLAVPPYILVMPFYLLEGLRLSPLKDRSSDGGGVRHNVDCQSLERLPLGPIRTCLAYHPGRSGNDHRFSAHAGLRPSNKDIHHHLRPGSPRDRGRELPTSQ